MLSLILGFTVAGILSLWFVSAHSPLHIFDAPNERSLHEYPIPRTGGLAILAGVLFGWLWLGLSFQWPATMLWIALAAFLIVLVSFWDDIKGLSPALRLLIHGAAAVVLIFGGLAIPWGITGLFVTWFAVVWMQNLYNFMDGMDGFAGGMAVFGFGFLAMAGWIHGDAQYALYCGVVAAAASGFLLINFPPARIFMGDVGSATLGLLAAAFSLWGIRDGVFSFGFPLLVFSPFIVDASITLLRRALRRERIWEAHCSHYYQRLVRSGWSHKKTVLAEYALMLAVGFSALFAEIKVQFAPASLVFWGIAYVLLVRIVDRFCAVRGLNAR